MPMITKIALALVVSSLVAGIASGLGHRLHLWSYGTGFKILAGAVVGAGIGTVLALIGLALAWRGGSQGAGWSVAALAIGLGVLVPPLSAARDARRLPYIHDVTTDTENPPGFVAILKERADAPNTAEYGGPKVAALQRQAYPDVRPLRLRALPADVFVAALETANALGWEIVESDPASGRIEASARTFWYGFIDDVVVRIAATADGTRVDVRSVSRVGKSDIGANARRIRKFLDALTQRVD